MKEAITNHSDVTKYVFGGKGTCTIESKVTGGRFTYKMKRPKGERKENGPIFIYVLTGNDNTNDYTFAGTLWPQFGYNHSKKSRIGEDAQSVKAFRWFISNVEKSLEKANFYHEGKCCMCGRKLTVPESIKNGIGPECAKK